MFGAVLPHQVGLAVRTILLALSNSFKMYGPVPIKVLFKTFSCSIVMGAEKGLWPITNFTHLYEKKPILTEYKYLNSGTYFGYTEKIIDHMNQIIDKNHQLGIDDQGKWTIQYLLSDDIIIDQNQDFFFSTFNSKDKILIDRDDIKLVDSLAFVVHDNGGHNEQTIKLTDLLNR
jgi:hypothetical protein